MKLLRNKKTKAQAKADAAPKKGNSVSYSEYNGHKIIVLNPEDRFPFQFGLKKAKLILDNIAAIEKFVAENDDSSED
jgi:hypothetical protein